MRRTAAAVGSVIFFALAPGVVAGFSWWLTGWRVRQPFPFWTVTPLRVFAWLIAAAVVLVVRAFRGGGRWHPRADRTNSELSSADCTAMYATLCTWRSSRSSSGRRSCFRLFAGYAAVVGAAMAALAHGYKNRPWLTGSARVRGITRGAGLVAASAAMAAG